MVLERACRVSYEVLIEEFLRHSRLGGLSDDLLYDRDLAQGYVHRQMSGSSFQSEPHRQTKALAPAGCFSANTDLTTEFFYRLYGAKNILPKKQSRVLFSKRWPVKNVTTDSYGLGTIFSHVGGREYIGHSGGFPGFSSQTWHVPSMGYTFGFICNSSLIKTFNVIRGMAEIVHAITHNFKLSEQRSLIVTEPMSNNYMSTIYVIGKSRVVAFPLTGWLPSEDIMIFKKRSDHYVSEEISGYKNVGEPLTFRYKAGQIVAVNFGGLRSLPTWRKS